MKKYQNNSVADTHGFWELFLIISITFATRIYNLLNIPIFTDEAIYIRWAQIGLADPAHRYISLTDGKQPLLTWFMYPMLKIFEDPLFAGRFVSVLSAILAVTGLYFISVELFNKKTAIITCLLYIISPFALIYDRLALMDSLLAAFGIWSLYLQVLLIRKRTLDISLLLGIVVGLALLTKSSAFFYLWLTPLSLLLVNFRQFTKKDLLSWIGLSTLSIIIANIIYNSLRLSPWFYIIEQKNHLFIITLSEFLKSPFSQLAGSLRGLFPILIGYLTWPIFITLMATVIYALIKKEKRLYFLTVWFLFPFLAFASFAQIIFPRFILFMVMPLFIVISYALTRMSEFFSQKIYFYFIVILILIYPAFQSLTLLVNPVNANIPKIDRNQLFDDWPSGYGVREVINYLNDKAQARKIIVGTEGTFGLNPAVYEIYLGGNPNVEIYGFWPVGEVPQLLLQKAQDYPTFLIFKEKKEVPREWPLKLISKYRRGKSNSFLQFFQVVPP